MTEPDVTLTDYGLVVECAVFTYLLARGRGRRSALRGWFVLFFGATGLAALAGGTVHGVFLDERTLGARILWPLTLLAIGVAALAAWGIGAQLEFSVPAARWISGIAAAQFAGYAAVVLFANQAFVVAILDYLPATLFLTVVFGLAYRRTRGRPLLAGLAGLALTFLASWIQQTGIALHPVYFNQNALQHVVQGVGLFLLFRAARWLVAGGARA